MSNICQGCSERNGKGYDQSGKWLCTQCCPTPVKQPVTTKRVKEPVPITLYRDDNALCPCGSGAKYKKCCKSRLRRNITSFPFGNKALHNASKKLVAPLLHKERVILLDKNTGTVKEVELK